MELVTTTAGYEMLLRWGHLLAYLFKPSQHYCHPTFIGYYRRLQNSVLSILCNLTDTDGDNWI